MTCHRCQTVAYKFGVQNGFQRYRCKTCGRTFSDIPARPLDSMQVEPEKAYQVIRMLCEGMGIRACERLSGLNRRTVLTILETAGAKCARLMDAKIHNVKVEQIEVDEIHSFVQKKIDYSAVPDPEVGEFYTYLSIDRDSKLVLNFIVGKHTGENCHALMGDLKGRINGRFQLSTDGFSGYLGKRGAVFQTFGHDIDYGTEVKAFAPDRETRQPWRFAPLICNVVKRTARIGNPDLRTINTSRVERLNLSIRTFNRRFTRCALGFSKKLANHKHSVALLAAFYNFCRVHSAHKKTPAMAAGLTDHAWTVEELLLAYEK